MADYLRDTTDLILQYLKDTFGDQYKKYWEGDPVKIPQSLIPCIVVQKVSGRIAVDATGTDNNVEQIMIKVILNKKDDFGSTETDADLTERRLRRIVEARDNLTGQYVPESIMGGLRTNITLGNYVLEMEHDIAYDLDLRPDDMITSEAHITTTVRTRILVPQRQ